MARGIRSTERFASRTRGRERMSALGGGESTREGGRSMARGIWLQSLSRTRGRERMSALGGESPRGREAGQGCGGFGQRTSVTDSRTGTDVRFGRRESTREGG